MQNEKRKNKKSESKAEVDIKKTESKAESKAEVDIKKSIEIQTENNFKYLTPSELFKKNMFDDKNFVSITQLNLIKEERDHYCNLAVDYKNQILQLKQEIEYLRAKK